MLRVTIACLLLATACRSRPQAETLQERMAKHWKQLSARLDAGGDPLEVYVDMEWTWRKELDADRRRARTRAKRAPTGAFWNRPAPVAGQQGDENLAALPYLGGYNPQSTASGVIVPPRAQAEPGLNLFSSGHAMVAVLATMAGDEIHRWQLDPDAAVFTRSDGTAVHHQSYEQFFRRIRLVDGGELLTIVDYTALVKLSRESAVVWSVARDRDSVLGPHHDLDIDEHGNILALAANLAYRPEIESGGLVVEDVIWILSPQGRRLREISILNAVLASEHAGLVKEAAPNKFPFPVARDLLHCNTLEILDGTQTHRNPAFRRGNLLLSFREVSTVAVLDPDREEIVWALRGPFTHQHDPQLLASGSLLLFDNDYRDDRSRVVELDPATGEELWSYQRRTWPPLHSPLLGYQQRLGNGNTLVTESMIGRVTEVTRSGTTVWAYANPASTGPEDQLVAVIPEMQRISLNDDRLSVFPITDNR